MENRFRGPGGGPTSVARAGEGGGNVLIGTETAGKMEGEKETWVLGGVLTNLLMFLFPSFFFSCMAWSGRASGVRAVMYETLSVLRFTVRKTIE